MGSVCTRMIWPASMINGTSKSITRPGSISLVQTKAADDPTFDCFTTDVALWTAQGAAAIAPSNAQPSGGAGGAGIGTPVIPQGGGILTPGDPGYVASADFMSGSFPSGTTGLFLDVNAGKLVAYIGSFYSSPTAPVGGFYDPDNRGAQVSIPARTAGAPTTTRMMWSANIYSGKVVTGVSGQRYQGAVGLAFDALNADVAALQAGGAFSIALSGPSDPPASAPVNRPTATLAALYFDFGLARVIVGDGSVWRDPFSGALV